MSTIANVHVKLDKALYAEVKHYLVDHDLKVSALVESAVRKYMQPEPDRQITAGLLKQVLTEAGGEKLLHRFMGYKNKEDISFVEAFIGILEKGLDTFESEFSK